MPYLNVDEVESALETLATTYPSLCELITLPNDSIEGRTCLAIRIGTAPAAQRDAVLLTGAVHAREWGGSEICVFLAADLCEAYTLNTGLTYGGKSFTSQQVKDLVEQLNFIVFPDVNPDGRHFSQTVEAPWRRNRNPADSGGNAACIGVDLNRNQDFLWDFPVHFAPGAVNTSADPCDASQRYRGSAATSEPEAQNVRWLMDQYPRIRFYIDIHCSGELILYSWGSDENQSSDSSMTFLNAAFDGVRGTEGDAAYREYIPSEDEANVVALANALHDSLAAVRGKDYDVGQAYSLYATSGANDDYAYSRHFADGTKGKVYGFTIEYGTEFQPPWSEMEQIVADVSAGILGFGLKSLCMLPPEITLDTASIMFNDVPEGETTARAVVFSVRSCQSATFQIVAGPSVTSGPGAFGTLASPTATLAAMTTPQLREARLWLSHTGTNDGDVTTGELTVRLVESGQQWTIPITANTIANPTVGCVLVLDQSGSMTFPSGLPAFPTRADVLRFAAPVFVNVLPENDGIGIVAFDHDAYPRMDVTAAGPVGPFDATRAAALGQLSGYAPNPAGNTAIGDGVELAHNTPTAPGSSFDYRAMVVFTDGHETASKYIADVAPFIDERVFAIGLGTANQIQPAALQALTNGTGGYLLLTGNLGSDDVFLLSKYYLQILAGVTNQDIVLDPEGALLPGQQHRIAFRLNEADITADTILLSQAPAALFRFHLETPAGDLITPATASGLGGMSFTAHQSLSFYRMTLPVPIGTAGAAAGKWHVVLEVDKVHFKRYLASLDNYPALYKQGAAHGVRYNLSVQSSSGLRLQARLLQNSNEPGATLTVHATPTEYGIPIDGGRISIKAELTRPDNTQTVLSLAESEPGVFEAFTVAAMPGVYPLRVLANGKSLRGRPFTREQLLTGAVWKGGDTPPPTTKDDPAGDSHERLCRLLACLLGSAITPELQRRLQAAGLDLDALRRCCPPASVRRSQ